MNNSKREEKEKSILMNNDLPLSNEDTYAQRCCCKGENSHISFNIPV